MPFFEKRASQASAWWEIEPNGVRYWVAWGSGDARGSGMTCTRASEEDCAKTVARKIRQKLKEGYVEVARAPALEKKPEVALKPVLEAYTAHAAKFKFTVEKLPGLERSYHVFGGLRFEEYILLGPAETVGLRFAVNADSHDRERVLSFLRFLEAQVKVFAVGEVWKVALPRPIGEMTHVVVLAPVVAQVYTEGLTKRQQFQAFPIYDCEFRGDENVSFAEARTAGRGSIPYSRWNRAPHPVVDLLLQVPGRKKAKLLVFDPKELAGQIKRTASSAQGTVLEVHNFHGEICRLLRGERLELRSADGTPSSYPSLEEATRFLEAFVRGQPPQASIKV